MHQEMKSSPAGILMPSGRPADSSIISTKIAMRKSPGEIAGEKVESIEKHADHDVSSPHTHIAGSNRRTTSGNAPFPEKGLSILAVPREPAR